MLAALLAAFFTDGGAPAKAAEPVTVKVGAYEYGVVYYFEMANQTAWFHC